MSSPVFSDCDLVEEVNYSPRTISPLPEIIELPHSDYDGPCTFLVENSLYRIALNLFNETPGVQLRIRKAQAEGGGQIDYPIALHGITTYQIDCLLDVAEPRNSRIFFNNFDLGVLRTAFKTASVFKMSDLKLHIIALLEGTEPSLDILQKLTLADELGIFSWQHSVYQLLSRRSGPLSDEEGDQLGIRRCLAICRVREKATTIQSEPALQPSITPSCTYPIESSRLFIRPEQLRNAIRHPRYYSDDVTLPVAGLHFRLPRYLFAENRSSEETLRDVAPRLSQMQMQGLLAAAILNPMDSTSAEIDFTRLESALEAATILRLPSIKSHLVQKIESLEIPPSPVALINLADRCDIPHWLKPQYVLLCCRREPLTLEEGQALGWIRAMTVCRLREELDKPKKGKSHHKRSTALAELKLDQEPGLLSATVPK